MHKGSQIVSGENTTRVYHYKLAEKQCEIFSSLLGVSRKITISWLQEAVYNQHVTCDILYIIKQNEKLPSASSSAAWAASKFVIFGLCEASSRASENTFGF